MDVAYLMLQAADTPFARDATFGYKSSNLHDWVVEKSSKSSRPIHKSQISSFELECIRREGPEYVTRTIRASLRDGQTSVIVMNAMDEADVDVVILGVLEGKDILPAHKGVRCGFQSRC